jgi:hypothetical protein
MAWQMKVAGLPTPEREVCCVPGRKYRFDFYFRANAVTLEVQGGTFMRGRAGHSSGSGIRRDCEKAAAATLHGLHPFAVTGDMVKDGTALAIIKQALETFQPF